MKSTETATKAKAANKKAESHNFKSSSAYGLTVELICSDLSLLEDRPKLLELLQKHGIDPKQSKNAVSTGISQTRNVVKLLQSNNQM